MDRKYYILTLLLLWTGLLFADDIKITASASRTEVATNDQFEVTFTINGNGDRFTPPNFAGFQVLSGPNYESSVTSINGNTTISNSYSYVLLAIKEGSYTIGQATFFANGRKISSNELQIKVVKGQPAAKNGPTQNTPRATSGGGAPPLGNAADISKSLIIRAVVDKDNVYQGQQLTVSFRIYTRTAIVQSQVESMPDLTGFWNEEVKNAPRQAQWHEEVYNGLKYEVADLKQTILFPEHAGNITIDPIAMTFVVRQPAPAKNFLDQFFAAYQDVTYKIKSKPLVVHVRPLPQTGKPPGYSGAVGNFSIQASLDKNEVKADEPLNYKLAVTGSGNIKLLKPFPANFPADFEKYDPKTTDTVTETAEGVSGTRFYNYLLIPRHQGNYTIDPIKFSYFNPASNRYVTLSTKSFQVKVDKGKNESNVTAFSNMDKQDIKILDKDIRYIKLDNGGISKPGNDFFGSIGYYTLLLFGPVLSFAALGFRNYQRKLNSDVVRVRGRKAGRIAAKHLASAKKQLAANNANAFYEDIFRGLYGYLSDKLNIPYADLNKENIALTLEKRSVGAPLVAQLMDTLDLCEMARYAPVTHISKEEVFEKAKNIINDIENKISG